MQTRIQWLFLIFLVPFLNDCTPVNTSISPLANSVISSLPGSTPASTIGTSSSSSSTLAANTCVTSSFSGSSFAPIGTTGVNNNQLSITVNGSGGSLCGNPSNQISYVNEPCVSVTLCSTQNPSSCQTINNILLDTGSYGLRIFSSVINISLTPITHGGSTLAECVGFGDGSSEWGPVKYAYIQLGNEPKVAVPILVIDSTYSSPPGPCTSAQSTPDVSPSGSGYNGILGVGQLTQDCGSACASDANNGQYYSCGNNNCSCGASVALAAQVVNPVSALPIDNNGVIVSLPAVSASGASSVSGSIYFGIDTESNNSSSGYTRYYANDNSQFLTKFSTYSGNNLTSFIDSGSSVLFIPPISALPDCSSTNSNFAGFFCPSASQSLTAINYGYTGSPAGSVSFSIGNTYTLFNNGNAVFSNVGSTAGTSSPEFDWGLPFFFGRKVYVGFQTASENPYWAY